MKRSNYRQYVKNVAVPTVVYGAITGVFVSTLVYFFKIVADWLVEKSTDIYTFVSANPAFVPLLLLGLVVLAVIESLLQKWSPETRGGGIPRSEGVLRGLLTFRWLRTGIAVIVNSFISFFAGLPLGTEGPSVLLGTAIGAGISNLPLSHNSWRRYIMTGGASAGFAVATNAPLTGIIFALEEAHKRFTPMIWLMAFSSVGFASATSYLWSLLLGKSVSPLFGFGHGADATLVPMPNMTIDMIWVVLLLGIAVGVLACLFNLTIAKAGHFFDNKLSPKFNQTMRLIVVFLIVGIVGLFCVDALYGGHGMLVNVYGDHSYTLGMLVVLLVLKFFLISLCSSTGATGGMFIPMLAVGGLLGGIMGKLFIMMGMSADYYPLVVVMAMSTFMGASTRAPLTAVVFVAECTWQFTNLFYVAVTVFVAVLICEVLRIEPLYDVVMEKMIEKQNHGKTKKILNIDVVAQAGSFAIGKSVRDIIWPANTKVNDIEEDDTHQHSMDDDGEKKIFIGDKLNIIVQTFDEQATLSELQDILGKQPELKTE